jgi:hypothetical protein
MPEIRITAAMPAFIKLSITTTQSSMAPVQQRARMSIKIMIRLTWSLRPKGMTSRVYTGGVWR